MSNILYVVYNTFTGNIEGVTTDLEVAETWGPLDGRDYSGEKYITHKVTNLNLEKKK